MEKSTQIPPIIKPKEGSQIIWLSVCVYESAFRRSKHYYPQVFSEECKYVVNPIQEQKAPTPPSLSSVTSKNVGISTQNLLTFSFSPFGTPV